LATLTETARGVISSADWNRGKRGGKGNSHTNGKDIDTPIKVVSNIFIPLKLSKGGKEKVPGFNRRRKNLNFC
jgi:hypothetical protein